MQFSELHEQISDTCKAPNYTYHLCYQVVNVWNSLPDYMVEADSVNSFKNRLDKYWANQEFVVNFNPELMGTGGLPACM